MRLRSKVVRRLRRTAGFDELRPEVAKNTHDLNDVSEHVTALYHHHLEVNHRVHLLEEMRGEHDELVARLDAVEANLPAVLNAISAAYGSARLLRREIVDMEARLADQVDDKLSADRSDVHKFMAESREISTRLSGHIKDELWPLIPRVQGAEANSATIAFLLRRVETIRAEMLHELRYGADRPGGSTAPEIVNEAAWKEALDSEVRLNLGCGHLPLDGFINVDIRKLPMVDVVAAVDDLPAAPESVQEIFSAHVLEHFPALQLERRLLPYWYSLIRPGGVFRAVVPDHDAMTEQYGKGEIAFITLREITYGGQDYDGDFHYNAFTPDSLEEALRRVGFDDIELLARARPNGDCLEFEMSARRPL